MYDLTLVFLAVSFGYAVGWLLGYATCYVSKTNDLKAVPVRTQVKDLYPKRNNDQNN